MQTPLRYLRTVPVLRDVSIRPSRQVYRLYAATRRYPPPRLLCNSIPKSGTHALSRLLDLYPSVMGAGRHLRQHELGLDGSHVDPWRLVAAELAKVGPGKYATSHLPAAPELREVLSRLGFRTLFMVRDPRDMLISYMFYVMGRERHRLHRRLAGAYSTDDERLMALIEGVEADTAFGSGVPSASERLDDYLGWIGWPLALTCRFEDLIGPRGGGDAHRQLELIESVGRFINRPVSREQAQDIAAAVWSPKSITFRKGKIGDWVNHFGPQHKQALKKRVGHHLVSLGYETDLSW